MQDEISNKVVVVAIRLGAKGLRLTEAIFRKALQNMLLEMRKLEEKVDKAMDGPENPRGKQTIKQLMEQNTSLSGIEITDQNIRSFEKTARKYSIDYSLMKDKTFDPPVYYVFFKGRDTDVMRAAFSEYLGREMKGFSKPEIGKIVERTMERAAQMPERAGEVIDDLERGCR